MFNGNSREVEVALQEHRIDLALLEGSSRLPSLKYAHFLDDELVMVMRTKVGWLSPRKSASTNCNGCHSYYAKSVREHST